LDEAGRGPLAGPVVAAAVALKTCRFKTEVRDSKQMSAAARERAFHEIFENAVVGIGSIGPGVIDEVNISRATFYAMHNAVLQLLSRLPRAGASPAHLRKKVFLLIDGNRFQTDLPYAYRTIVSGDSRSLSVACASVVAKVYRDRVLSAYDRVFPQYGFRRHKGYPTLEHRRALKRYGPSVIHRLTFQGVE
jgi:ribonuclease HII